MLYVAASKRWIDLGEKRATRRAHTATELADGRVLIAGGADASGNAIGLTEIFGVERGAACTSEKDCPSGFCVDSVCCDTACDQPCAACNVMGRAGTCSPVTGPPVGGRDCGGPIPLNPCAVPACDGKNTASCAGFAADATRVCIPGRCEGDILVGAAKCDGLGKCVRSDESSCAPFSCRDGACLTTCASATDCSGGASCEGGKCVARARCTDDKLGYYGPDGKARSCGAFRCGPDGACVDTCTASDVCAPGFVCDTNQHLCTGPSAAPGDDGGCAYGHGGANGWALLLAIAVVLRKRGGAR